MKSNLYEWSITKSPNKGSWESHTGSRDKTALLTITGMSDVYSYSSLARRKVIISMRCRARVASIFVLFHTLFTFSKRLFHNSFYKNFVFFNIFLLSIVQSKFTVLKNNVKQLLFLYRKQIISSRLSFVFYTLAG